tara:strand:+ start:6225 stop:6584 length:360 start_codon:yes stop_codon:yes gene_type:complete
MKILIAEDQPMVLKTISYKLQKSGFNTIGAIDGQQAKAFFDEEIPDLVIADLMMPFVSGFELLQYIREKYGKKIPIIILSAVGEENRILEAFELGADDFMTKPFIPSELIARTKRLLRA